MIGIVSSLIVPRTLLEFEEWLVQVWNPWFIQVLPLLFLDSQIIQVLVQSVPTCREHPGWKQTIKSDYGEEPGIVGQSLTLNIWRGQLRATAIPGQNPLQRIIASMGSPLVLHLGGSWWLVPAVSTVRRAHPRPIGEPGRNLAQNY